MSAQLARAADPDFVPSLKLLLEREQYSMIDVALMFGVSRERVRQWVVKHRLPQIEGPKGLSCVRVWDDSANRFRPVTRGQFKKGAVARRREARLIDQSNRQRARRSEILSRANLLREELGHDPTITELRRSLGVSYVRLLGMWDSRGRATRTKRRELFETCRLAPAPRGEKAHLIRRVPSAMCQKHGIERRTTPSGCRYCPTCQSDRKKQWYNNRKRQELPVTLAQVQPDSDLFGFSTERDGERCTAFVATRLNALNGPPLRDRLKQRIADGAKWITINLAACEEIERPAFGDLLAAAHAAKRAGGAITVLDANPQVFRAFHDWGVAAAFTFAQSEVGK